MKRGTHGDQLTFPRRYWPTIHTALKALKGRWTVHANGPVMIVSLEPHLAELLRAVLPAGAISTPRGEGGST